MNKNRLWGLLLMLLLLAGCTGPKTEATNAEVSPKQSSAGTGAGTEAAGSPETPPTPNPDTDAGDEPLKGNTVLELTEEQNGGLVALIVNDTMRIVIDGNPSTGFTWETENLDTTLLEQQGEPTFTFTSNLKGGGGNFVFTFKALRTGITQLRLIYHRPFEKDTPPERIFEVSVDIQQ